MNRPALEEYRRVLGIRIQHRFATGHDMTADLPELAVILDALLAPDAAPDPAEVAAYLARMEGHDRTLAADLAQARALHVATMRCENCGGHDLVDQGRGLYYCALANWSA